MRWLTFILLAVLSICWQTTVAPKLSLADVYPNFVFVLLVHYALHASARDGMIVGWSLGLLMDLTTVERMGVTALVYSLCAMAICFIRGLVFRDHPLTHLAMTWFFGTISQLILMSNFTIWYGPTWDVTTILYWSLGTAFYSGLWAVVLHALLLRLAKPLGLVSGRRSVFQGRVRFV